MDPSQSEPAQPASSDPPVAWQPSAQGSGHGGGPGTGALFNNRPAASLTLGDAITTGFTIVSKPTFIVPILVIGLVVNAIVAILFTPVRDAITPSTTTGDLSGFNTGALAASVLGSLVFGIIGGVLLNLYGQIWAVAASSGPLPEMNDVISLIQRRWIGIIATGLVVGAITIGLLLIYVFVTVAAFAALGVLGLLVLVAGFIGIAWVGAKLSMSGWLAAEGANVGDALNGSWQITQGNLLRIIGWGFAYGILFGIVSGILGAVLGLIPVLGPAIAQAIGSALGYGGGVTLYRRTQAAAAAMGTAPSMPASSMAS